MSWRNFACFLVLVACSGCLGAVPADGEATEATSQAMFSSTPKAAMDHDPTGTALRDSGVINPPDIELDALITFPVQDDGFLLEELGNFGDLRGFAEDGPADAAFDFEAMFGSVDAPPVALYDARDTSPFLPSMPAREGDSDLTLSETVGYRSLSATERRTVEKAAGCLRRFVEKAPLLIANRTVIGGAQTKAFKEIVALGESILGSRKSGRSPALATEARRILDLIRGHVYFAELFTDKSVDGRSTPPTTAILDQLAALLARVEKLQSWLASAASEHELDFLAD